MSDLNNKNMFQKVLVIDDNEIDRYIAARNIKAYNFADEIVAKVDAPIVISPGNWVGLYFTGAVLGNSPKTIREV